MSIDFFILKPVYFPKSSSYASIFLLKQTLNERILTKTAIPANPAHPNRQMINIMLKASPQTLAIRLERISGQSMIFYISTCIILTSSLLVMLEFDSKQTLKVFAMMACIMILCISRPAFLNRLSAQIRISDFANLIVTTIATRRTLLDELQVRLLMFSKIQKASKGMIIVA